ncbi:MAG: NapC/NirT family cytochrome c [Armatimonadetes bacterium]|nr:NapC/NirT family cytochrome c [Armatimonadota bacterium]
MRRKLPVSFYNLTTLVGVTVAAVMLALITILIITDSLRGFGNPYMGLVTYIALPAVMIVALLFAWIGFIRTRRRLVRGMEHRYPTIDLNSKRQRSLLTWVGILGVILMALSGFGSYQAYDYTESVKFCGQTCHGIMGPEYTAYQHSPHAKVGCKECHVGPGANSYMQSKLAGSYQLMAALTGKYHKPIPTPVKNIRSSKETCETCHWTGQFYSPKLRNHTYYLADDTNSTYQINMMVKVGTTDLGKDEGIHSHMYLNNQITYIATDAQRQVIPYVEMHDKDGKLIVYRDTENPADAATLAKGERHTVDCIDCHNRPTHQFPHPDTTLNFAFGRGQLDPSIPELKTAAVEALEKPYKTQAEGLAGIKTSLVEFYKKNHPNILTEKSAGLDNAVAVLQEIYGRSYFPEMKADWKAHPDNLDHIHSSGCFRCHDDKHVSAEGRVISKNCQNCHLIVGQGKPGAMLPANMKGLEFKHPTDVGDAWKTTPCKDCHGNSEGK